MAEHARLGCSNPRWEPCPGSIREEAKYPNISSEAAKDGTGSHLLLEMCLKNGVQANQYAGQTIGVGDPDSPQKLGWFVDADRIKRVQVCLDYVETRMNALRDQFGTSHNYVCVSETKSNPGVHYGRDDWWGTCDISIFVSDAGNNRIFYYEVVDYKDGKKYVSEVNNKQLRDYLLGKIHFVLDGNRVVDKSAVLITTIVQPNIEELFEHGEARLQAAMRTDDPDAPLVSGDHCFFCRHKDNCAARKDERIIKGSVMDYNIIAKVETELQTMSGDELAKIIDAKDVLLAAFGKAEDEAQKRLEAGQDVPGYYIGEGNATNVWNDDEEVIAKKLGNMKVPKDERYVSKIISPAQARKLECLSDKQKANLESLITTMAGKPKLKKGVSKKPDAKQMFSGVDSAPTEQPNNAISFDFM
jgi:hypothetical protein